MAIKRTVTRDKPPSRGKSESRPARKTKSKDPAASHNRTQKEARLQREKGGAGTGAFKKFVKTPTKSPAKFGEYRDNKFDHKPADDDNTERAKYSEKDKAPEKVTPPSYKGTREEQSEMRLNKYLAHSGVASRRAADTLILQGHVKVNGEIVKEMGYKVQPKDVVTFKDKPIKTVDKLVYYLLNKPRNVLTTSSDERGRRTVIDIMSDKIPERIYPVGRLDRNTSGLILLTNDGELTKKLSHPSYKVPKVYLVTLDKNLSLKDMEQIREGITLEDGPIKADSLHFIEGLTKREVEIEVHSGRNRLVRRIFEHFGYEVVKLDRTYYAGLTKKNLPRGMWRPLTKEEVRLLKHFT
ncbi:MAG TPA: pseudouridine synthase [Saprospiraceae bacterium]|nr:pseudouridine synthase [Saprospiraceae bacterium]